MGNLNMLKERNPQACLTKGCYAGCHTRWRGLEFHLYRGVGSGGYWGGGRGLNLQRNVCFHILLPGAIETGLCI